MSESSQHRSFLLGGAVVLTVAVLSLAWRPDVSWGLSAGGAWGLANLWCLSHAMRSWLTPERSGRAAQVGWFLLKFPLLYGAALWLLTRPGFSVVGFGAGFSFVLLGAVAGTLAGLSPGWRGVRHGG